jgi:hypothetical protein
MSDWNLDLQEKAMLNIGIQVEKAMFKKHLRKCDVVRLAHVDKKVLDKIIKGEAYNIKSLASVMVVLGMDDNIWKL